MCLSSGSRRRSSPPPPPAPPPPEPTPPDLGLTQAPDTGNMLQQSMTLPGGLGTIESVTSSNKYTEAPVLDSPFGMESQRVKREKARLSIAP